MIDVYATLGLQPRLVLSDDDLRDAYLAASKREHPDAGGGEGNFADLRAAHTVLASPSRRLKVWLELHGIVVDPRGSIDTELMDLFGEIGTVLQRAEALIRKREDARSALAHALLEKETQACREAVEGAIRSVAANVAAILADFPRFERCEAPDFPAISLAVRNLAFLEKWRTRLQDCFARLV